MREPEIGTYLDADHARHTLVVRETADGDWHVLDIDVTNDTAHVVDALAGDQDGRPQAEAVARDYLTTVGAREPGAGPAGGEPIPEQGGSDARSHRRPRPAPRQPPRAKGCAAASGSLTDASSPGRLSPERHRALQLGILHEQTGGLVEIAAGARRDGRLQITTRRRADHFLPGGGGGGEWLGALLTLAGRHVDRGEEVFVAPAVRASAGGEKRAVSESRWLWVDVDQPGQLHALWAFLAERPCHLLVETAGSGGVHAYWLLAQPLPASHVNRQTGELVEPIERANLRIDPPPRRRPGRQADRRRPRVRGALAGDAPLIRRAMRSRSAFRLLVRLRTRP